jgi:hypothetical protein
MHTLDLLTRGKSRDWLRIRTIYLHPGRVSRNAAREVISFRRQLAGDLLSGSDWKKKLESKKFVGSIETMMNFPGRVAAVMSFADYPLDTSAPSVLL